MTEVPCPECGATLEGPYEGRVACQACGCILIFEGDTVRIVQENHVKQIILGTKTQTRRNHNNVEDRAQQKKEAAFNQLHGPSRPYDASRPGGTTGAKKTLSPTTNLDKCNSRPRQLQKMAKRDTSSMPFDEYFLLPRPSSPTIQCPPDCPSKRFCDPSSCALESVRESNAIVEALRRAA